MRKTIIPFAIFLLFSVGCVQYHYSPNFVQTPFAAKKGEGAVSAAVSGSPTSINGDFHASYSPVKHGTVMLNYFRARSSVETANFFGSPTYLQSTKGHFLEGAVGGYAPFSFGTAAIYVGWGKGQMRNDYGIQRIAELGLRRFFVQPTFTFKNDWLRLGMGLRFVRLSFPTGDVDYRIEPSDIEVIQRLERESPLWFPELGGNIGVYFKPVTITGSLVFIASPLASEFGFDRSNVGIGISLELQELFKKQEKKKEKKKKGT